MYDDSYSDYPLPGDVHDNVQMSAANPDPSRPWWEGVAQYGITRLIDNRLAPAPVNGNTNSGSFAGQNGATYANGTQATGASAQAIGGGVGGFLSSPAGMLALAGAGVIAFLALRG